MKHFSHLNTALAIIASYQAQQPFHLYIKDFFRQDKKYGSRDRKAITHLCYCWFRAANLLQHLPPEEKMLAALFLCTSQPNELLAHTRPQWHPSLQLPIEEKCHLLNIPLPPEAVFPWRDAISPAINKKDFILSHFVQPQFFLRIRPGHRETVTAKLDKAKVTFSLCGDHCLALANTAGMEQVLDINREVVVQDYSSQQTGRLLQQVHTLNGIRPVKVWDCCAASGGKSIMAADLLGSIDLTVSDIRVSVLTNLEKRFEAAGIRRYASHVADLTAPVAGFQPNSFQLIIADVPCSGSGTWGRTPERLSFFDEAEINRYRQLQEKIVTTIMPYLAPGGCLLYITCSVFEKENEGMVAFIQDTLPFQLLQMETLQGYQLKADTMFAALLQKKS